jgi:hypothetical protein
VANATGFGMKRIDASRPLQQACDEDLTSRLKTHLPTLGLPTHLFLLPKSSAGLGRNTLWGDGAQPAK